MFKNKVLLVDDEDLILDLLGRVLHVVDIEILIASSAADALDLLSANDNIGFLLTDLTMPGMSGTDLIREAQRQYPGLACGVMSGSLSEDVVDELLSLEVQLILEKPFQSFSTVVALIAELLCKIESRPLVLVADDCREFRQYACDILRRNDISSVGVSKISSMKSVLRKSNPNLLLVDSMTTSGEVIRVLSDEGRDVPFVSCSSLSVGEREDLRDAGAVEMLTKPVGARELVDVVRKHLDTCAN